MALLDLCEANKTQECCCKQAICFAKLLQGEHLAKAPKPKRKKCFWMKSKAAQKTPVMGSKLPAWPGRGYGMPRGQRRWRKPRPNRYLWVSRSSKRETTPASQGLSHPCLRLLVWGRPEPSWPEESTTDLREKPPHSLLRGASPLQEDEDFLQQRVVNHEHFCPVAA